MAKEATKTVPPWIYIPKSNAVIKPQLSIPLFLIFLSYYIFRYIYIINDFLITSSRGALSSVFSHQSTLNTVVAIFVFLVCHLVLTDALHVFPLSRQSMGLLGIYLFPNKDSFRHSPGVARN
jgi:hypothetical protein